MPSDASHLVLSVGGKCPHEFQRSPYTHRFDDAGTHRALESLASFEGKYRRVVELCRQPRLPLILCAIYNGSFPDPGFQQSISTALMVFNDVIFLVAIEFGIPVIDLRFVCSWPADYANPIEPSSAGGAKIARAIVSLVSARHSESTGTLVVIA
jgi:hypothetical protein